MHRRLSQFGTIVVTSLTLLACGDSPGNAPNGIWEGTNVTIELSEGQVTSFRLEKISCAAITNDPDCDDVYPVAIEEALSPLEGGSFTLNRDYLQVEGTMDKKGASGTYHFVHAEGCCELDGTWEAAPPKVLNCGDGKDLAGPSASLSVGLTDPSDGTFESLEQGDELDVVRGFQGALMVVPSLRLVDLPKEQSEVEINIVNEAAGINVGYIRAVEPFQKDGGGGSTLFPDLFVLVACKIVCPLEEDQEALFIDQEVVITPRFKNACGLDYEGESITVVMRKAY